MIQSQNDATRPFDPRSCATFKAGQDGLQERLHIAGHAQQSQLSREDTLTDLSEMLKTTLGFDIDVISTAITGTCVRKSSYASQNPEAGPIC